jgi:hypothetical protein
MSQQINLYQAKFRKERKPLSAREALLGLMLVAVSVIAYSGVQWDQNERLAVQAREVAEKAAAQKKIADQLNNVLKARKKDLQLDAAAQRAEQQVVAMREVMQLVEGGALGNPNGYSEQFRALSRQAVAGLWLTGFTLAGNADENVIRGRVVSPELVATYLRRLNEEKTFHGQRFASLTISTPRDALPGGPAAGDVRVPGAARSPAAPPAARPLRFLEFSVAAADAPATAPSAKAPGARP